MTDRGSVGERLAMMRKGEDFFLGALAALGDDALARPSRLPGWTRAHVVAHVARNADALVNLLKWARTGVETPMYATPEQREADIARTAAMSPPELRSDASASSARLVDGAAAVPPEAWGAEVRTARGRTVSADEVPWMRCREVWIHAVDLDAGVAFVDAPGAVVDLLLDDVAGGFARRDDCASLTLEVPGDGREWTIGETPRDTVVSGPPAELLAWLAGRGSGEALSVTPVGRSLPALPAWL